MRLDGGLRGLERVLQRTARSVQWPNGHGARAHVRVRVVCYTACVGVSSGRKVRPRLRPTHR